MQCNDFIIYKHTNKTQLGQNVAERKTGSRMLSAVVLLIEIQSLANVKVTLSEVFFISVQISKIPVFYFILAQHITFPSATAIVIILGN